MIQQKPLVRATGIMVEQETILLVKQELKEQSNWSLPGGRLEFGETLEACLVREMQEETGLHVEVQELLYLCDRFKSLNHHVVDISFLVRRLGGRLYTGSFSDGGSERLSQIRMVPFSQMIDMGFSDRFTHLLENGLPDKGSYQGDFHAFYG